VQLAKQVPVASGKAEQAAAQFESFFLYLLLRELDKTVPRSGFLGSTLADDFFRDMYYERLADALCEGASPLGLSELIGSQLDSAAKEGEAVVAPDPAGLRLGLFTKAGYPLPQLLHD